MDFFIKYKKVFIGIGLAFIAIAWGYLIYFLFFKPAVAPAPVTTELPGATTTAGLPEAVTGPGQVITPVIEEQKLPEEVGPAEVANGELTQTSQISKIVSSNPTLAANGKDLQFYDKESGNFYRVTQDGKVTLLDEKIFHQVENVTWSPDKNKAILEYPDGSNIFYDFNDKQQVTLPKHWQDFDFSPESDKIVAKSIGLDAKNRWLVISNTTGSKITPIESLGENEETVTTSWSPNNQIIAMYTKPTGFNSQEVFFVGQNGENFKSTIVEGRNFQPKWSPSGNQLLYSVYTDSNDMKPGLWIVNASGDTIGSGRKNLNIETWAEKCTFAGNSELYCAIPEKLEQGAGLFPELAKTTNDRLYKIDTVTGLKKLVATTEQSYTMTNLAVSDDGQYLYFKDEATQTLQKVQLK